MDSLSIDFRGGCIRILIARDGSVKYSKIVKDCPSDDIKTAGEVLASEIKRSDGKRKRVNVILPADVVKYKIYPLPSMDLEDAKKVIRREIAKELKEEKFIFGVRRLLRQRKTGGQEVLAEYALASDVMKYLNLLKKCRIRPDIVTTSLSGNISLFNRLRPETDGNEAFLDIGINFIEITVFNNSRLVDYTKILMPPIDAAKLKSKEMSLEHTAKIRIYIIVDALYNYVITSGRNALEEKLSLLWLGGLGSITEGIADSISDGLGVNTQLIAPFETPIENGNAFSALAGLTFVAKKEQVCDLIPEDILETRTRPLKQTLLAASFAFYVILLGGGYLILNQIEGDLKISNERLQSVKTGDLMPHETPDPYSAGKGTLEKIISGSPALYSIFRDIANLTPSGVVLNDIQIEKTQDATNIKISATIKYTDESMKNALLSRFYSALDGSSRLKRTLPPEISTAKGEGAQNEILVKAKYEVAQ